MHCCKEPGSLFSATSSKAQEGCCQVPHRAKCITVSLYSVNAVYHGNYGLFYEMQLYISKLWFPRETAAVLSRNQRAHIFASSKMENKKRIRFKKKTTNQPYLQKCIFIFKKEPTPPPSNAALELEHPPPVYASISTIRLLYNNSHIHK